MTDLRTRARSAAGNRNTVAVAVLLVLALIYPLIVDSLLSLPVIGDFVPKTDSMVVMIVFTTMAIGLNMVVGYAGLLDLGYVAFYAVGAYTAGWFASQQFDQTSLELGAVGLPGGFPDGVPGIHISMWLVLPVAGMLTMLAGIVIGLPTLPAPRRLPRDRHARIRRDRAAVRAQRRQHRRLRPHARHVRDQRRSTRSGSAPSGAALGLPESFRQSSDRSQWYFWTAVVILLITVFCSVRLRDSRLGRAWVAIREDETAAAAMGIPLMRTKTWAYAIGAFFGGVAGAFYASFKGGAFPADFYFNISVFLLCMVILGGMGSVWGVILGGMILGYLNVEGLATIGSKIQQSGIPKLDGFDPTKYQFGIYGIIIVLMMLFRPTGLIPERRHKIEMAEGVHDTPFYDVQHEGTLTDRDPSDD